VNDIRGSLVKHRVIRAVTLGAAALVIALAGAACSSTGQPTPIYVIQTPTPAASDVAATPTAAATPEVTAAPTATVAPSASPSATPTPTPTPATSSSPTSAAAFCTGKPTNQPTFVQTAKTVKFAVYCPTMTTGWSLVSWSFDATHAPGWVKASYKGPSGSSLELSEGSFCLTPTVCSPPGSPTSAAFGGLTGSLFNTGSLEYSIYVAPGTKNAYQVLGHHMSQATLTGIATALKIVPKA
jgi:hypothetical protein